MTCTVPDCDRTHHALGLCSAHYMRLVQCGDVKPGQPIQARLRCTDAAACAKCEDIEFLLDTGTRDVTEIATRTVSQHPEWSRRREALLRHLRRHGRTDLVQRITARLEVSA